MPHGVVVCGSQGRRSCQPLTRVQRHRQAGASRQAPAPTEAQAGLVAPHGYVESSAAAALGHGQSRPGGHAGSGSTDPPELGGSHVSSSTKLWSSSP